MRFSFKQLYKVIAVRLRKDDPVIKCHDSGDPVPVATPGVLSSPALPSDSSAGHVVSARIERRAQATTVGGISDKVQLTLAGVQGIPGPIPLAGSPLQAAISGLLKILQTIDRHAQNKAAIASLRRRLHRLSRYLCNTPFAQDSSEQSRRDELICLLQDISDQLAELDNGGLVYQSVTQALAGFSTELDHYLAEYAFAAQMHTQDFVVETETRLQQFGCSTMMDLPRTVTLHCLILEDATGHEHKIPVEFCMSLPQFDRVLDLLFHSNTDKASIQRRYLERGQYDLCIDQGTQVIELTREADRWSTIEAGTKVIMRVIIDKILHRGSAAIKCDACGCLKYSVQSAGMKGSHSWTISCQGCERRYQVSIPSFQRNGYGMATDLKGMSAIRNMHVREMVDVEIQREEVRGLILQARYTMSHSQIIDEETREIIREIEEVQRQVIEQRIEERREQFRQALQSGHEHVLVNPLSIVPIQYHGLS